MPGKSLGRILVGVSCLMLLHAAFSTYEHVSTSKALGIREATVKLPISIMAEALAALVLFIPSVALSTSPLEDVTYRGEMAKRSIEDSDARPGYMKLSRRGRVLFGDR